MKKQLIERFQKLAGIKTPKPLSEQANVPFVCMNLQSTADAIDDGQSGLNSSEGYCVNTFITGGNSLHQQFANAGFGTYTTHSTLEECINDYNAGGNCNQGYEFSVYPPPSGGQVSPVGIKGPPGVMATPNKSKMKPPMKPKSTPKRPKIPMRTTGPRNPNV